MGVAVVRVAIVTVGFGFVIGVVGAVAHVTFAVRSDCWLAVVVGSFVVVVVVVVLHSSSSNRISVYIIYRDIYSYDYSF